MKETKGKKAKIATGKVRYGQNQDKIQLSVFIQASMGERLDQISSKSGHPKPRLVSDALLLLFTQYEKMGI
jgi:hypothetical protein